MAAETVSPSSADSAALLERFGPTERKMNIFIVIAFGILPFSASSNALFSLYPWQSICISQAGFCENIKYSCETSGTYTKLLHKLWWNSCCLGDRSIAGEGNFIFVKLSYISVQFFIWKKVLKTRCRQDLFWEHRALVFPQQPFAILCYVCWHQAEALESCHPAKFDKLKCKLFHT